VGACQTLHLKPAHLDAIMAGFPGLTRILCRQFTTRLKEANEELRELRARFDLAAERRMVQAGETIHGAGTLALVAVQLVLGSVRVLDARGSRVLRAEDLPGGFLGLRAYLLGLPQAETAVAEEPCFLAVVGIGQREALLRCYPAEALAALSRDRA
jgi:CRP-like cAMP-binding protein